MKHCPSCGHENPEQAKFCIRCGKPLAAPAENAAPASAPTLCSKMCHIEEYADKPDHYGLLIHSMESYERIKKWDGQVLNQEFREAL